MHSEELFIHDNNNNNNYVHVHCVYSTARELETVNRLQMKRCTYIQVFAEILKDELLNQGEFVYRSNIIGSEGLFTVFVTIDSSAHVMSLQLI